MSKRISSRPKLVVPERAVRRAVRDWLDAKRIPYVPIEARKPIRKNGQVIFTSERPEDRGIADFLAFRGISINPWPEVHEFPPRNIRRWVHVVAIECKRSHGGRHSEAQKAFQARWAAWGFTYLLVRSVDELIAQWPR